MKIFKKYFEKKIRLIRVMYDPDVGKYFYTVERTTVMQLPANAKPVTGNNGAYAVLDDSPIYPKWYDEKTCKGFGAIGYHLYFTDTRTSDAFKSVAEPDKVKLDWKKWLIIAGAAVIFVFILIRFIT